MPTITFTPTEELLAIDEAWRLEWAEALMTSKQHKFSMCNGDDTAHCCLCVLERLHEAEKGNYIGQGLPSSMHRPPTLTPDGRLPEHMRVAADQNGEPYHPAQLNDSYLTHPQIAALLRGETVTIEKD